MRSKADQDRLDAIHAMPCICCEKEGVSQPSRTEAHHIVDKGYRKHSGGHQATLSLCGWHHRADVLGCHKLADPPTFDNCTFVYGPSFAIAKRRFIQTYGTERELLAEVDERLAAMISRAS